jgi:hypothetical protein
MNLADELDRLVRYGYADAIAAFVIENHEAISAALRGNNSAAKALQVPADWPPDYQARFWSGYPNKKGKLAAHKALEKVAKSGKTRWDDLMTALERYKMSRDVQRGFIKHPATWLNQGCWTDEEGPPQRNNSAGFFEVLADMGKS